jgi:hypothetical protein
MSHSLGIVIEALVAVLLLVTIGYCMLLNKRLERLKSDEQSLKATIGELITVTEIAERAIGGLKHTVRDVNENIGSQIASATGLTEQLVKQLAEGDNVLRRLSKIAVAARPLIDAEAAMSVVAPATADASAAPAAPVVKTSSVMQVKPQMSAAKANAAAAQAFAERSAERRRLDGLAA